MVVALRDLTCFDYLLWLRTGQAAAARLGLTQASVSRRGQFVADTFSLQLLKDRGEWSLSGDPTLLNLERSVHQLYRWDRGEPLRIDATYCAGPMFFEAEQPDLVVGNFDFLEIGLPLQLLRSGVIDCWIGCFPDLPDPEDPELACFHLTRTPTKLVVAPSHPLVKLGPAIGFADLEAYPSLALAEGAFPRMEARLRQLGLWNSPVRALRYNLEKWEGQTADALTIGYATSFTLHLFDGPRVCLPLDPQMDVGDTLVVRRAYAMHPRCDALLERLRRRARELARTYPDVRVVEGPEGSADR